MEQFQRKYRYYTVGKSIIHGCQWAIFHIPQSSRLCLFLLHYERMNVGCSTPTHGRTRYAAFPSCSAVGSYMFDWSYSTKTSFAIFCPKYHEALFPCKVKVQFSLICKERPLFLFWNDKNVHNKIRFYLFNLVSILIWILFDSKMQD